MCNLFRSGEKIGWVLGPLIAGLIGCDMPRDPDETFKRIRGGVIRVGITENQPWTKIEAGEAAGVEPELLAQFARGLRAKIQWTADSEADLVASLRKRKLDVVVGGLNASTPWHKYVALTQPYLVVNGEKHVMAAPQGENRWLLELDRFLGSYKISSAALERAGASQ